MENLISVQIETKEGINVVSSRVVAEQLGKEHGKVIRSLENIILTKPDVASLIIQSNYVDKKGETRKEYLLTKDGFTLYMFNIQGYNDFKMAYINAFNEMERTLREKQPKLPTTYKEALKQLLVQVEENERLQLENTAMKPKAEFFDAVADSKDAISMNEVAKVLAIKGMGRNNLFEFLRQNKILMSNNVPFQTYVDRGYFRVIEQKYMKQGEPCMNIKTLVYQKGVEFIRRTIEEKTTGNRN